MRSAFHFVLGLVFALAWCAGAQAQARVGRSATSLAGAHMVRSSQFRTTFRQADSGVIVVGQPGLFPFAPISFGAFPVPSFAPISFGVFPVPGLGFDFAHLAAVTRSVKVSDLSVLTTAQRLALAQRLTPFISFAVPFLPAPAQVVVVQQPPVVVVQPPPAEEAAARRVEPKQAAELAPPSPPRDVGEFVLVRRDGRMLFAIAFSTEGDSLVYITPEGVRRTLPLAELDVETTLRMNEERGTTLHLSI